MKRFKSARQLQRFVSIHDPIANLFHFPRHTLSSDDHRDLRAAAMHIWREILSLVLQHDEQAVLTAVEMALEAGVPTKTHILNLLHRLIDGKSLSASVVDTPQALSLAKEPKADVERYDALRQAREVRHAS